MPEKAKTHSSFSHPSREDWLLLLYSGLHKRELGSTGFQFSHNFLRETMHMDKVASYCLEVVPLKCQKRLRQREDLFVIAGIISLHL